MMKAIADCQHDCQNIWCDAGSRGDERSAKVTRQSTCSTAQRQQQQQQQQGPDISRLHPLLQSQWNHAKNLHLGSVVITPGSNKQVWWTCGDCPHGHPHEWQAMVSDRTKGVRRTNSNGCPQCISRVVCAHNTYTTPLLLMNLPWQRNGATRTQTSQKHTRGIVQPRKYGDVMDVARSGVPALIIAPKRYVPQDVQIAPKRSVGPTDRNSHL